ncbi:hypothetical protein NicSoilB4_07870 [Arthrobacter sp. NicSoilB4]|nr:hypothetical protein NicSoilB4_07870 [Arthrobacter sp. NicSoilB4]
MLRILLPRGHAPAGKRPVLLAWAAATLALDGFALWLCLVYAPARFFTSLSVIVRQVPDVGIFLGAGSGAGYPVAGPANSVADAGLAGSTLRRDADPPAAASSPKAEPPAPLGPRI